MNRITCTLGWIVLTVGATTATPALGQLPPAPAGVQVSTEYDIEFSTVAAAGNASRAPSSIPFPTTYPYAYGAVGYEYRMARTEVTTAQWVGFLNTFSTQAGFPAQLFGAQSFAFDYPLDWAAYPDPTYSGPGVRYSLNPSAPNAAGNPVRGISWRDAALYCNWLHNGQSADWSSLWSGAYDTATFGGNSAGEFTDQITRSTGARFWIPSYDEWAKAAWFDPNKDGPGLSGYWMYPTRSDSPPIYGWPGVGTANAGFGVPLALSVASYPDSQSAWGLFDMAGSGSEWTEWVSIYGIPFPGFRSQRGLAGSAAGMDGIEALMRDTAGGVTGRFPNSRVPHATIRIAGAVPCVPNAVLVISAAALAGARRRRDHDTQLDRPRGSIGPRRDAH